MRRFTSLLILLLSLLPAAAHSQTTQVGARVGWLFYDGGGDQSYPMLQLSVEHSVASHIRVGVQGS
jgi:hypothetical protein